MKFASIKPPYFFLLFVLFFVACQTAAEQAAHARAAMTTAVSGSNSEAMAPPDNTYSTVKLGFSDTSSPEGRLLIARLDSFYRKQVAGGFNGSVLVGYKGQILYERYFGMANRETGLPLGPKSSSQLASTSKTFTATAILWLHQNKYLNVDDPVQKYLKDFPYEGITISMLLNHRSGLPNYTSMDMGKYWGNTRAIMYNEDLLQIYAKFKPKLNSRPNTRFEYCNTNYAMLARIIEEVSQMSYRKFMKQFIFEPLGMKHTFVYDPAEVKPENLAISYKYNWQREPDMFADGIYGDKGIYSTVEDMYRWDQSFYNNALLNEKTLRMAYAPYSFEKGGVKNYGFGWRMMNYPDGYKIIYHNGWWHGNNTVFFRFVKDNFTVIVLGNKYNSKIYSHSKDIYSIVKGTSNDMQDMTWEEEGGSPTE